MINCVWYNGQRGSWDHGLLMEIFDSRPDLFIQHNTKDNPVFDRAIVCLVGKPDVKEVREYLDKIGGGHVMLLSEEDAYFHWEEAIPERFEVWTQYYYEPTKFNIKNRILLGAPNRIKDYKINSHLPKKYLISFVGQVQNPYRQECVDAIQKIDSSYVQICSSFGGYGENGLDYQEYLDILCQSKFVACPSGSMSADSFRVYESILCGAIPIVDKKSPRDAEGFNYWNQVYYLNTLWMVENWSDVKTDFLKIIYEPSFDTYNIPIPNIDTTNNWFGGYVKKLKDRLISIAHGS